MIQCCEETEPSSGGLEWDEGVYYVRVGAGTLVVRPTQIEVKALSVYWVSFESWYCEC